jgi:beta-galactosidase
MKNNIWVKYAASVIIAILTVSSSLRAGENKSSLPLVKNVRQHLLMDFGWRFALGHAADAKKDFNHATGYFSYVTKAGYGDGPASKAFDDRPWRILDLPHDWAVELPFDSLASYSHGYKTVGRNYPATSIGWYRKTFTVPASDLGKRISIQFDGVHRKSTVWVNGFYLGEEHSGYYTFQYDITDYLNYGGENVVAVRVDASMEEGW